MAASTLHLRALALLHQGHPADALPLLRRSIELDPAQPDFHANLGVVLAELGQLNDALAAFKAALALKPDHPAALHNLAATFAKQGQWAESAETYRRAADCGQGPDRAAALLGLSDALRQSGALDDAESACREAIALEPASVNAWLNLATILGEQSRPGEAVAARRRAVVSPTDRDVHSGLLYTLHYDPSVSREEMWAEHQRWAQRHGVPPRQPIAVTNDSNPKRRLRIGYVSPDFRRHSVATFFEPLLTHHDHKGFEIVLYSSTRKPDDKTAALRAKADGWRDIAALTDDQAVQLIRQDGIDILVDLTGHMGGNRLSLFARRAAPVQVTYVGHPDTTGLLSMDYRLTDAHLDPPDGGSDRFHSEKLFRLEGAFGCYQAPEEDIAVGLPPCESGPVTFGCLNNPAKITPQAVELWCRILFAIPGSCLMLLGHSSRDFDELLAANGVAANRIERLGRLRRGDYLRAFQRIDLALDTFPYNGQTTSCDGFWMGVPLIALEGDRYVSRMGHSLLHHLGLPGLIAKSPDQYVEIAVTVAKDLPSLSHLRSTLRDRLRASPLMDGHSLARRLEVAYQQMWQDWCAR